MLRLGKSAVLSTILPLWTAISLPRVLTAVLSATVFVAPGSAWAAHPEDHSTVKKYTDTKNTDSKTSGIAIEEKNLRAQEEALLKQLTGGSVSTSASDSTVSVETVSTELEDPAQIIAGMPSSGSAPKNSEITRAVSTSTENPATDKRVEQLIDEQARAALAAIADVKERVAASKAQLPVTIPDAMPIEEIAQREALSVPTAASVEELKTQDIYTGRYVSDVARDETALAKVTKLSKELGSRDSELSHARQELSVAQRKAVAADARAATLARQVEALRAKLMVTETEVERLSRVIEARNKQVIMQASAASGVASAGVTTTSARSVAQNPAVLRERVIIREGKAAEDLPVVVVTSDKANLRTGPGQDNSSLMAVSKGNRLVVETKQGAWYRVFTPNGVRAWISAEAVQLQRGGGAL